jgi:hypothetical protein
MIAGLAISLAALSLLLGAALVYFGRRALNAGDATVDAVRTLAIRDGEALRAKLAADTADSLRAASEERVAKLEAVLRRAAERTADALTAEPLVFASRADALAAARRLFAPAADVPDAAADRGDADADGGVPDLASAVAAGRSMVGVR